VSQLRLNPLTDRWVTIAVDRASRSDLFAPRRLPVESSERPCPFCPGNEEDTPPALETYARDGRWLIRVVPNLYPAFEGRGAFSVTHLGPLFAQAPGTGIHEVLVLSPDHRASWADLDDKQVGLTMAAIRDRMEDHARQSSVRYTQTIVNHGREAGASREHPHGQLLGIPFVPEELVAESRGFDGFMHRHGECLLCTTAQEEADQGHRVVHADDRVLVVCPFWSAAPFEMLVIPRAHEAHMAGAHPADLVAVGRAVRDALAKLGSLVGDVPYNLVLHTAPHHGEGLFHWHLHVLPRLTSVAGFEAGTGVLINIVAPEAAAADLRDAPLPRPSSRTSTGPDTHADAQAIDDPAADPATGRAVT
jgi:UDPglucose--hexose-1-phosphate uridylyltransferase